MEENPKALLKAPIIDYADETKYRILDGGAVYGLAEGRIIAHLKGSQKYSITRDNARAMLARKQEIFRQQVRDAIDSAALAAGRIKADEYGSGRGLFALMEKTAELAFDAKTGRSLEGVLTILLRAGGVLEKEGEPEKPGEGPSRIVLLIAELARRRQAGEVIDAESVTPAGDE